MPSPKSRDDFLRCQMCKNCYDHKCRDMTQMTISLCKKHHWPTYNPDCPDFEETDDPNNWAKREYEHRKRNEYPREW